MLYLSHILKNIFYVLCARFAHIFCIYVYSCNVVILRGPQGRIASANCVILYKQCINKINKKNKERKRQDTQKTSNSRRRNDKIVDREGEHGKGNA